MIIELNYKALIFLSHEVGEKTETFRHVAHVYVRCSTFKKTLLQEIYLNIKTEISGLESPSTIQAIGAIKTARGLSKC